MPLIDFNTTGIAEKKYDLTIVGAGAAGILLAVKASKSGKKVLLIETGHFDVDDQRQQLNEIEHVGKVLENSVWGRKRAIGGTTVAWGGQSLPFQPLDFQNRDWINSSGWPIQFDDLKEHYDAANEFMKIDTLNYGEDIFRKFRLNKDYLGTDKIAYHFSKWAPTPNFYTLYKQELNDNVDLYYNCHLLKIIADEDNGRVAKIEVTNFKKELQQIEVSGLVIAAGALETNRLLLLSNFQNFNRNIGRGFMEHPCIEVGDVAGESEYKLQKHFNTHIDLKSKVKYSLRLSATSAFQKENKLLNVSAGIMFKSDVTKFDPYSEIKRNMTSLSVSGKGKLLRHLPMLIRSGFILIKDKFYYKPGTKAKLVMMCEQEASDESRITLSNQLDEFGLPKLKLHWKITKLTWDTIVEMSRLIKTELERSGIAQIHLYDSVKSENDQWEDMLSDVNHHMGGCRMSSNAETGVVDSDLKVFGFSNLYLCSCAVFPTSSHSNPTLTLLALADRLIKKINSDASERNF